MPAWANSLFYLVFIGQILVISWYFPRRLLQRMRFVVTTYPPDEYPKLYPQAIDYYLNGQRRFKLANQLIIGIGMAALLSIMFLVDHSTFADDGFISEAWPAAYGLLQFLPLMALELSECGQYRLMRKLNADTTRTAELRPRRLFEHVSPALAAAAVLLFGATFWVDLYVHGFDVGWGHDSVSRLLVLLVTNLLLAALAAWLLYGRKLNPHQHFEDRTRQIAASVRSFLFLSIVMSVFFMTQALDDVYELGFLDATLVSLYFQVVVFVSLGSMLRNVPLEDINFGVYKRTESAPGR